MTPKAKSRRNFLVTAGVGGTGAAIAAATAVRGVPTPKDAAPAPEKDGYRLSEHIQKYYKTTEV
jgi:hypothetical protein